MSEIDSERIFTNRAMSALLDRAVEVAELGVLDPRLEGLASEGMESREGALVLHRNARQNSHLFKADDLTGSEAAINELHLDDYFNGQEWPIQCVGQGILLARRIFEDSREITTNTIEAVIAVQAGMADGILPSATFRFYCLRPDDRWLADDIELYGEAILTIQSPSPVDPSARPSTPKLQ